MGETLVTELRAALSKDADPPDYPNASILLRNIESWIGLAKKRELFHPLRSNFGVDKSDLLFGKVEDRLRELEAFYFRRIFRARGRW